MGGLGAATRAKLKTVSVATLTTALFRRGLRNQFIQDVHPLNPGAGPMVGEAFTLRYIPAREDLNPLTVFRDRAHPQRKAVEECPPGAVFVTEEVLKGRSILGLYPATDEQTTRDFAAWRAACGR